MADYPVRRANREYVCHDCGKKICVGDMHYHRSFDYAIYCIPCYNRRYEKWRTAKSREPTRVQALLEDLLKGACSASQLQKAHGNGYVSRLRKLKSLGYPIGRRKEKGGVIWYVVRRQSCCASCGRRYAYVPMAGADEPSICEQCALSLEREETSRIKEAATILEHADQKDTEPQQISSEYHVCIVCGCTSRYVTFCSARCAQSYLDSSAARD